jgi:hypothetical protein
MALIRHDRYAVSPADVSIIGTFGRQSHRRITWLANGRVVLLVILGQHHEPHHNDYYAGGASPFPNEAHATPMPAPVALTAVRAIPR